jgi:hypothetical protein
MTDFNSLRANFSIEDEGARDLSEQEFLDLNRVEAEKLIANVKNVKVKSGLQKIYDHAHSQGKKSIICSHSSFFASLMSFPVYCHLVFSHVVKHVLLSSFDALP